MHDNLQNEVKEEKKNNERVEQKPYFENNNKHRSLCILVAFLNNESFCWQYRTSLLVLYAEHVLKFASNKAANYENYFTDVTFHTQ